MKKLFILSLLCVISLTFAQTSKEEITKIIKEQSDGIPGQTVNTSVVYNDSKETIKQVYNDAKAFSPKIEKAVESLASSLKTTANKLWDILVKQQFVWSCCFLILTLASIFNWYVFYRNNFKIHKEEDIILLKKDIIGNIPNPAWYRGSSHHSEFIEGKVGEEEIPHVRPNSTMSWFKYLHLCICLVLSGLSFYHFTEMLTGFINPEYGALQTILEVANKLK